LIHTGLRRHDPNGRSKPVLVEAKPTTRFDFLDADATYVLDPEGNILECLAYDRDADNQIATGDTHRSKLMAEALRSITEVGLPGSDPVALREWYPTDRPSGVDPIEATVGGAGVSGRHEHPTEPYSVVVE